MFMIKAIVASGSAFAGALGVAAADRHVTLVEWCIIAGATLTALGAVYAAPKNTER